MTEDYRNFIRSLIPPRHRKYPIKRDEYGQSARRRAFDFFDEGYRPAEIDRLRLLPVSLRTLLRYYEDWKKIKHRKSYSATRRMLKKDPELTETLIQKLAENLGMSFEEVMERKQRPWGLLQLLKGEIPNKRLQRVQSEIEYRLESALRLIIFSESCGKTPKEINQIFMKLLFSIEGKNKGADDNSNNDFRAKSRV